MFYKVINRSKNEVLLNRAEIAKTFWRRLSGLMFRKRVDTNRGLIFYHTNSIHTCFMRFPLDVVFLDKNSRVVKIKRGLKPWRATICRKARVAVEFPSCYAYSEGIELGDSLDIKPVPLRRGDRFS